MEFMTVSAEPIYHNKKKIQSHNQNKTRSREDEEGKTTTERKLRRRENKVTKKRKRDKGEGYLKQETDGKQHNLSANVHRRSIKS